ncbi:MAG: small ribosomal subunit Rsm22 family protein [Pseudomonadota bacterium]|nr:small ribosomal subunit Rsm22 family protein [Pseudomonadota bacterium]
MEFSFPEHYYNRLEVLLNKQGFTFAKPKQLANAILALSDHYIHRVGITPWEQPAALAAYIAYFFPLNYIRACSAIYEANRVGFFKDIKSFVDFGSGPGTFPCALNDSLIDLSSGICIERYKHAPALFQSLYPKEATELPAAELTWHSDLKLSEVSHPEKKLLILSYALLELGHLPDGWEKFNNVLIVEPSDRINGRNLLSTRETLRLNKFHLWAPCTHLKDCPLLPTKSDWCHHRVFWQQPKWFGDLEKHLPIKNKTLTYSFLAASRSPPPNTISQFARLTGDQKNEKGKFRQMVCRSPDREFLSWLKRDGTPPEYRRGELIKIAPEAQKVSNEIRVSSDDISVLAESLLDS